MNYSYAGLWARVLAFALDYLIIAGYLILVAAVGAVVNLMFPDLRSSASAASRLLVTYSTACSSCAILEPTRTL